MEDGDGEAIVEHKCPLCLANIIDDPVIFSQHFQQLHPTIAFACYLCEKAFSTVREIYEHLNLKHGTNNPDKEKIALYDRSRKARGIARVGHLDKISEPEKKLKKLSGGQRCCVPDCKSTSHTVPAVKLFRFPAVNLLQRYLWVSLVDKRNEDGSAWEAKPWHRICSLHFEGGNYSKDEQDVNFIPTLFKDALDDGYMFRMPDSSTDQVSLFFTFLLCPLLCTGQKYLSLLFLK